MHIGHTGNARLAPLEASMESDIVSSLLIARRQPLTGRGMQLDRMLESVRFLGTVVVLGG